MLVDDCYVARLGDMNFDFFDGGCTVRNDEVFLCFGSSSESNRCRRASNPRSFIGVLANYEEISLSQYGHAGTRIASSNGKAKSY